MWYILICSEDSRLLKSIKKQLLMCAGDSIKKVKSFSKAEELLFYIALHPDEAQIIIIDILLSGEINGIELGKQIKEKNGRTQIIFMADSVNFCEAVYEVEHVYFMKKPLDPKRLKDAVLRAGEHFTEAEAGCLAIITKKEALKVPIKNIIYMENDKRLVRIHLMDGEITCYGKLDELMTKLPWNFIKCHNSYVVNAMMVQGMSGNHFRLKDGKEIPISKSFHRTAKNSFLNYLEKMI